MSVTERLASVGLLALLAAAYYAGNATGYRQGQRTGYDAGRASVEDGEPVEDDEGDA